MTQDEARKWAELFNAFADGKQIEDRKEAPIKFDEIMCDVSLSWFRIKPEPKYVPFTHYDWKEFMFFAINRKGSKNQFQIIGLDDAVLITKAINGDAEPVCPTLIEAFENFTFSDGRIFGKLMEE